MVCCASMKILRRLRRWFGPDPNRFLRSVRRRDPRGRQRRPGTCAVRAPRSRCVVDRADSGGVRDAAREHRGVPEAASAAGARHGSRRPRLRVPCREQRGRIVVDSRAQTAQGRVAEGRVHGLDQAAQRDAADAAGARRRGHNALRRARHGHAGLGAAGTEGARRACCPGSRTSRPRCRISRRTKAARSSPTSRHSWPRGALRSSCGTGSRVGRPAGTTTTWSIGARNRDRGGKRSFGSARTGRACDACLSRNRRTRL